MEARLQDLVFADLKYAKGWVSVERLDLKSHKLLYGKASEDVRSLFSGPLAILTLS